MAKQKGSCPGGAEDKVKGAGFSSHSPYPEKSAAMAKRIADTELTDRNWDQEDESEEAGTFSVASEDVLKNRAIKKAKRRNNGTEADSSGAFKGFKGLGFASGGSGFPGFGNGGAFKPLEGLTNGNSTLSNSSSLPGFKSTSETKTTLGSATSNGPASASSLFQKTDVGAETNGQSQSNSSPNSCQNKSHNSANYNRLLTALNCAVRDWITKHVDKNPLCDLTPIFKDYEKHLVSIEQQCGGSSDSGSDSDTRGKKLGTPSILSFGTSKPHKGVALLNNNQKDDSSELKTSATSGNASNVTFNFGKKIDSSVLGSLNAGSLTGFSFGSGGTGTLFGKDVKQGQSATLSFNASESKPEDNSSDKDGQNGEEENEEPPKVIVSEVKEDDAFYSKKCKLFYKKDDAFKEKGVGTLHLKPVGDKKTQLLIRADTSLGNILLNILIQPSMPCTRTANNVIIVCVPNPPIDERNPTTPFTMLIRVKTAVDAEELHKILVEKKEA